ncbi:MAG: hypothetical protein ACXVAX_12790 [Pseudobdellovibrio sp.]
MDRVLLIIDDIQYNRQVEMTLRKIGFEVESVNNEFNVNEPLLAFNPDYIVVRGNSNRLNVLNVGKKLAESSNHNNGKVILVFPDKSNISPDDLFKVRADLVLTEPMSTLRLVMYLISISGQDMEFVKEKLMKFAVTDSQFRITEQQLLKNAGITIDSEIENLTQLESMPAQGSKTLAYMPTRDAEKETKPAIMVFKDDSINSQPKTNVFKDESQKSEPGVVKIEGEGLKKADLFVPESPESLGDPNLYQPDLDARAHIKEEIIESKQELPLRIETYNRLIKGVDQDLKIGLRKRQTKKEFNQLHKDLLNEKKTDKQLEDSLDNERVRFTKALFDKKKE